MLRTFTPLLLHFSNPLLYTNRRIATIETNKEIALKALWEEQSMTQPLLLQSLSRLQGSPVIALDEQARILFQMALSFESREELDTHAVFQSLVEQAAKFTPRMLYFFGFALMGIIRIKPLSFTHLLTLGPKNIIDPR